MTRRQIAALSLALMFPLAAACVGHRPVSRAERSDARWLGGDEDPGPRKMRVAMSGRSCPDKPAPRGACSEDLVSSTWSFLPRRHDDGPPAAVRGVKVTVEAMIRRDRERLTAWEGVIVRRDRSVAVARTVTALGHVQHQLRLQRIEGVWKVVNDDPRSDDYDPS